MAFEPKNTSCRVETSEREDSGWRQALEAPLGPLRRTLPNSWCFFATDSMSCHYEPGKPSRGWWWRRWLPHLFFNGKNDHLSYLNNWPNVFFGLFFVVLRASNLTGFVLRPSANQCDQIGRFLQVLGNKLSHKVALIIWWFLGYFLKCKKCVATFWAIFGKGIRQLFVPSSGHTGIRFIETSMQQKYGNSTN